VLVRRISDIVKCTVQMQNTKCLFKVLTISTTVKIAAVLIMMGLIEVKMKLLFNKATVYWLLIMMLETELAGLISSKKSLSYLYQDDEAQT